MYRVFLDDTQETSYFMSDESYASLKDAFAQDVTAFCFQPIGSQGEVLLNLRHVTCVVRTTEDGLRAA